MEVRFDDKKLEKLCTDEKTMRKKRGDIAPRLRTRINALRTATRVGDLATLDPLGRGTRSLPTSQACGQAS